MKNRTTVITFLAIAAFAAGCGREQSTTSKLDQLAAETKDAAQDLKEKDYTYEQKAEFTAKMQSQLAEINRELDQLAAKVESTSGAVREEARFKLQTLREQAAKLGRQLDEAKTASETTWDNVKAGSRKAYGELKEGFTQARQWASEKIAP